MKSAININSLAKWVILILLVLIIAVCSNSANAAEVRPASQITSEQIDWMKKVADWQLAQSSWDSSVDWLHGTLFAGMMACYETTKDETYLDECRRVAQKFNWELQSTSHLADHNAAGQLYMELYLLDAQDPTRYEGTSRRFKNVSDTHVALWPTFNCDASRTSDVWWWCDALFMAPPALVRLSRATGDTAYTNLMHKMWTDTQDCLYDTEEHLFFRDTSYFYPARQNCNGDKVFWSRGNGWVVGGTTRVLQYLPLSDSNRPRYTTLLQEMAGKLKDIQQPNGYWYSDLLGSNCIDNPETSGTGFFTFGIAWGINNGLLDEATYWPTVEAAWEALKAAVQPNGLLGWVQAVAPEPGPATATTTTVYGVGAYLLAASEVLKYQQSHDQNSIEYFESYANDAALQTVWADGDTNNSAGQVTLGDYGDNFMQLSYTNNQSPYQSQTDYTFVAARDFTLNNVGYLSILVRGDPSNTADVMYVRLEDQSGGSSTQLMTDTTVVRTAGWMELGFSLAEFKDVNLKQIKKLCIGVGLTSASSPAGTGLIRIDNIRLAKCVTVQADFNNDCKVNMEDFAFLSEQWLDIYTSVVTPADPGIDNLKGWWKFDETEGMTASDSSGNNHVAQLYGDVSWQPFSGKSGGAIKIDGSTVTSSRVEIPASAFTVSNSTVSMWIYLYPGQSTPSTRYIFGHTTQPQYANRIQLYLDGGNTELDLGFGSTHALETNLEALPTEQWIHLAMSWNGSVCEVYVNGVKQASSSYSDMTSLYSIFQLGNTGSPNPTEAFYGMIDEVTAWDRVLTFGEILYLAEASPAIQIPNPGPTDLNLDGQIDLDDLLIFMESWSDNIIMGGVNLTNDIQMVTVPDVVGITQTDAELNILAANLAVGNVTNVFSDTVTAGVVISQSLTAGTSVLHDSAVDIVVSLGTEIIADVYSYDLDDQIGSSYSIPLSDNWAGDDLANWIKAYRKSFNYFRNDNNIDNTIYRENDGNWSYSIPSNATHVTMETTGRWCDGDIAEIGLGSSKSDNDMLFRFGIVGPDDYRIRHWNGSGGLTQDVAGDPPGDAIETLRLEVDLTANSGDGSAELYVDDVLTVPAVNLYLKDPSAPALADLDTVVVRSNSKYSGPGDFSIGYSISTE